MAFLRKKDKYWQIVYSDQAGKRREQTTKETNKRAAELKLSEFERRLKRNDLKYIPANSVRITLSAALSKFVTDRKIEDNISPATEKSYQKVINRFINTVGDLLVTKINQFSVKQFNEDLRDSGVTQTTFATYNNHLHSLFNWLINEGYYSFENPFKRRKPEQKEVTPFPPMTRLLLLARLKRDGRIEQYTVIGLAYYFALRIQEVSQLTRENFDLTNMMLEIQNQKGKREDTIPILNDASKFLSTIDLPASGRLFPSYSSKEAINSWWMRLRISYKEKYGMDLRYKFHSLRSARATDLLNAGHDLYFVKELMRHKSVNTTLKHYTKRKLELQRQEMNKKINIRTKVE